MGGILALILFGVMLSPPDPTERKLSRVGMGLVAVGGAVAWVSAKVAATVQWSQTSVELPAPEASHAREIGVGFLAADQYVVAFELAAVGNSRRSSSRSELRSGESIGGCGGVSGGEGRRLVS